MTARITRPVLVPGSEPTDDARLEQARVGAKLCAAEMASRVRLAQRMARAGRWADRQDQDNGGDVPDHANPTFGL